MVKDNSQERLVTTTVQVRISYRPKNFALYFFLYRLSFLLVKAVSFSIGMNLFSVFFWNRRIEFILYCCLFWLKLKMGTNNSRVAYCEIELFFDRRKKTFQSFSQWRLGWKVMKVPMETRTSSVEEAF